MALLTLATYFAAGFIYSAHFYNRCCKLLSLLFLFGVLVLFQFLLNLLSPPITDWSTESAALGILLYVALSWLIYAPPLFCLDDVLNPVHFIWILIQLAVWTALLLPFELLSVPWGSLLAAGLFIIWAFVCAQINKHHCAVFHCPEHAAVVYSWLAFFLVFFITLPWTVVMLAGGWDFLGVLIGFGVGIFIILIASTYIRPRFCVLYEKPVCVVAVTPDTKCEGGAYYYT